MDFKEHDAVKLVLSTHHKGRGRHPMGQDVDEAFRYVRHMADSNNMSPESLRFACEIGAAHLETTARLPDYTRVLDLVLAVERQLIPEHLATGQKLLVANTRSAGSVPSFVDISQARLLCGHLDSQNLDAKTLTHAGELLAITASKHPYMPSVLEARDAVASAKNMRFDQPFVTYEDRMKFEQYMGDLSTRRRLRQASFENLNQDNTSEHKSTTGNKP